MLFLLLLMNFCNAQMEDIVTLPPADEAIPKTEATTKPTGTTTPSVIQGCVDKEPNCAQYLNNRCKDEEYAIVMADKCAATCGACCVDRNRNCNRWKMRGFCKNKFYSEKERKVCAATCGMCD